MNAGPFPGDRVNNGTPDATPAQGKKDDSSIPDWAKITADFDDLPEDTDELEQVQENPVPAPASPYGNSEDDLDGLNDEVYAVEETYEEPAAIPSQPREPEYEDEEEVEETRKPRKQKSNKPKSHVPLSKALTRLPANKYKIPPESESGSKGRKYSGGRWKVLALRIGVWSSFGMILLVGVFTMFGPRGPSVSSITSNVLSEINRNAFPLEEGEQLAARFIERYLTYDPATSAERSEELQEYVMDRVGGGGSAVTLITSTRPQVVVDGPYLAAPAELVTDNHVVYTFAVEVENPGYIQTDPNNSQNLNVLDPIPARWVYIAVPMISDAEGHIAVADIPAFVPQPPKAEGVEELLFAIDRNASLEAQSAMTEFFRLWGESYQEGLRPYLVFGESTEAAQIGLRGSAEFVNLNSLDVEELPETYEPDPEVAPTCVGPDYDAPCRQAAAKVTWKLIDGTEFTQSYRLLIFNDGQNWRVIDIRGGKFDSLGR